MSGWNLVSPGKYQNLTMKSCIVLSLFLFSAMIPANGLSIVNRLTVQRSLLLREHLFRSSQHSQTLSSINLSAVKDDSDPDALSKNEQLAQAGSIRAGATALYKFTRPHTIRGTILASIAGTIRALIDTPGALANIQWGVLFPRACIGMVALILGNAFIVGINQIFDEGIDKMNKPYLPVASGEMSKRSAWITVLSSGIIGPMIVKKYFPALLFKLYMIGWILGAIYSVPPIRTKQNPILAALTIAIVRGFLLNVGVYFAVKDAIGVAFTWSPKVSFIARFMTAFAACIAVTKDLPDTEGDMAFEISTFATKVGVPKIAKGATLFLLLNYIHAIATGLLNKNAFRLIPMIGGHAALAVMLMIRFANLNAESMESIKTYYKHIWDMFYLEYGLYTLI